MAADEDTPGGAPGADVPGGEPPVEGVGDRPSTSISKERADGQDSRATAHIGEDPDAPSTRITEGRGIAARIAEHEGKIQHKDLTPEEVAQFLNPRKPRRGE